MYFVTPLGTSTVPLRWGVAETGVNKDKLPHLICDLGEKSISGLHELRVQIQRKKLPLNSVRFWVEITSVGISNSFYLPSYCFLMNGDLKSLFTELAAETGWQFGLQKKKTGSRNTLIKTRKVRRASPWFQLIVDEYWPNSDSSGVLITNSVSQHSI